MTAWKPLKGASLLLFSSLSGLFEPDSIKCMLCDARGLTHENMVIMYVGPVGSSFLEDKR